MATVDPEKKLQSRVLHWLKDDLGYTYIGDLRDIDNTPIKEDLLSANLKKRGYTVFPISAATGKGVDELMKRAYTELQKLPPVKEFPVELDIDEDKFIDKTDKGFEISRDGDVYVISGTWIEAVGGSVNFSDNESLQFFQNALKNRGVIDALVDAGIKEDDTVRIGDLEFSFVW